MISRKILLYVIFSIMIVALNSSVNFFDPFSYGVGNYSTSVGSSTSTLWVYVMIGIDFLYAIVSIKIFKSIDNQKN